MILYFQRLRFNYQFSIFFNMVELRRIPQSIPKSLPVFHVAPVVAYSRVENVLQRVPPKEQVTQNSYHTSVFLIGPQFPQVSYRVHFPLFLL